MAIIQISKIQHRSGNIQDLPQLDAAEIGIAVDLTTPGKPQNRIFVGPVVPVYTNTSPTSNNIEILSQFSGISLFDVKLANSANSNTYYPVFGNAQSGNMWLWANANLRFDVPSGTLHTTYLTTTDNAIVGNNLTVAANLVVNGNLTYLNTESLTVEDPLISQGAGPNGGILPVPDIKDRGAIYASYGDGATFNQLRFNGWDTSSSRFVFADDVTVNPNETVNIISTGDIYFDNAIADGDIAVNGGDITTNQLTFNLVNATATTMNFAGSATTIGVGAAGGGGIMTIRNDNVVMNGDLQVQGGDLTTNQTTFNLVNTTATTVNFAGAATTVSIGATTGNSNVNNNLRVAGNANISGIINSSNTTAATAVGTGALQIAGGGSIGQDFWVGGQLNGFATTAAVSPTTGAVRSFGGLGVAGNIFAGGNVATDGLATVSGSGIVYGTWTLAAGASFQATYADLAEYYIADANYSPGTVVEFGGQYEITVASDETARVAGVISTNPAYAMNANVKGQFTLPIALVGRVPCKVRGNISKGDLMTSGGGGYARPTHNPKIGTIIGKALENFSGEGIIEIAVHRH